MSAHLRAWLALGLLALAPLAHAEGPAAPAVPSGELPIVLAHPHGLGRNEARKRVRELLEYWGERFGVTRVWQGDTARLFGHLFGIAFEARLVVTENTVMAEASDRGIIMGAVAIDYINRKLDKYLHPTYQES